MKTVTFIRHAKSCWDNPSLSDFDRPLNKRGKKNAPLMGERLARRSFSPSRIYSSGAKRARTTAGMIADAIGYPGHEIQLEDTLYTFSHAGILNWLVELDDVEDNIAVAGHNPAITELVNYLAHSSFYNIPTCGVAQLALDIDRWRDLDSGCGEILFYLNPKQAGEILGDAE